MEPKSRWILMTHKDLVNVCYLVVLFLTLKY